MSQTKIRAYARTVRNLALLFGFAAGLAGLVMLPGGLAFWLVAPALVRPYVDSYPAAVAGLAVGLMVGLAGAVWYRRSFPGNPRGPGATLVLLTGFGLLCGLGYALLGVAGGLGALLFCALGIAAFVYLEKTRPD